MNDSKTRFNDVCTQLGLEADDTEALKTLLVGLGRRFAAHPPDPAFLSAAIGTLIVYMGASRADVYEHRMQLVREFVEQVCSGADGG